MFDGIIGNQKIKDMLLTSVKNDKISHSYLFLGVQGIGKKMIAKEFAKMLLCLDENKYCNNCKSCIEFDSDNHPDKLIVTPDGNSIKIQQIRELQNRIQEKPIISERKVYIIDDADLMTKEAQNCLLKTLEEPPKYATIILIGTNENEFLATIKSRCMIIHFEPIENEIIKRYLEEKYGDKISDKNILDIFQGSIGKAISLKDKVNEYQSITSLVDMLGKKDVIDIIKYAEPIYKSKEEIFEILDYINILLLKKAKENYLYTNCINIVEETKKRLKQNANYDMSIDNMIFNMCKQIPFERNEI